ncbi:unnamed protein product [Anisakis simplex]|uniref:Short neuropeptide F n=1 Tax=Anisakis simplex TaxID=6269 RepID=A0A0M3KGU4_ANISI|nr:unnamed protein product [Anisakis simplex]
MLGAFLFCFFGTSAALPIGYHTSARPDLSANASQSSGSLSFPDTIWLGGIVPYKIDKQFEEFVREALFGNKSFKELMSKTEDDLDAELKMILRKGGFSDGDYRRSPIHRTQPYGKSTLRGNRFDDSEIPVRPIEYRKQVMHHGIHSPVHSNQYDESMRRFDGTSTDSNSISEGLKSSFDLDMAPSLNTIIGQNSFSIDGLDRNDSINDRLSLLEKQAENFISTNKLSTCDLLLHAVLFKR